jgi:hypothetical protein
MARRRHSFSILILCIVLGAALWGYVTLTRMYEADIALPLSVSTPPNQALLSTVPDSITVRVRATGIQILNLKYFTKGARCDLDLMQMKPESQSIYNADRDDLVRSVVTPNPLRILSITPNAMTLATGDLFVRSVPVKLRTNIACREGFEIVTPPTADPLMVEIRGTKSVVEAVESWPTQKLSLEDVHESMVATVDVSDSLMTLLNVVPSQIKVAIQVQQTADVEIMDVPVVFATDPLQGTVVEPSHVRVRVRGGVDVVSNLTAHDLRAVIPAGSTGTVTPTVALPRGARLTAVLPHTVRVSVRVP